MYYWLIVACREIFTHDGCSQNSSTFTRIVRVSIELHQDDTSLTAINTYVCIPYVYRMYTAESSEALHVQQMFQLYSNQLNIILHPSECHMLTT
jgi:hypothetical protein